MFQKRLKYGLPTDATIALYELGFSDRAIAKELASSLGLANQQRKDVKISIKSNRVSVLTVIDKYPRYFLERANELF